jgi:hypothetical protein
MHPILLRELKSQFRVKPSPTELYSSTGLFKVFDRVGPLRFGWTSVGPNGIRQKIRDFYTPETFCEVYVYGDKSGEAITMEATNVYQACRPAIERLVQKLGGTIEDTGRYWIARVNIPFTECGTNQIRACAEVVACQRRKGVMASHRIGMFSVALHKLANALHATVDAIREVSQRTPPPMIVDPVGIHPQDTELAR